MSNTVILTEEEIKAAGYMAIEEAYDRGLDLRAAFLAVDSFIDSLIRNGEASGGEKEE